MGNARSAAVIVLSALLLCVSQAFAQGGSGFLFGNAPPLQPASPRVGLFNPAAPITSGLGTAGGTTTYNYSVVAYGHDVLGNSVPTLMGAVAVVLTGQSVLGSGVPIVLTTQQDIGSTQYDFLKLVNGSWQSLCLAVASPNNTGAGAVCTDIGQATSPYVLPGANVTVDLIAENATIENLNMSISALGLPTQNLNMNGFHLTNLSAGAVTGDSLAFGLNSLNQLASATGSYNMNGFRLQGLAQPAMTGDALGWNLNIQANDITGNPIGGPFDLENYNLFGGGEVDLTTFGAKYDLRSSFDMSCTNGGSTCTSNTLNFSSQDVGKLLAIVGPAPGWQASNPYPNSGQFVLPLTQNANGYYQKLEFPGVSGASPPVPSDWIAADWYEGPNSATAGYDCILPTSNNVGAFVYCVSNSGGQTGVVRPAFNQTPGGTTSDNQVIWTNEGTSTWPQCRGCLSHDGTAIWVTATTTTIDGIDVANSFTGCINSVVNPTTIGLGVLSGGICTPTVYPGVSANNLFAALKTDDTAAVTKAIASFQQGQGVGALTGGMIRVTGYIGLSNTVFPNAAGVEMAFPGCSGNPTNNPPTGGGVIWFGPAGSPVFEVQSRGTRIHDALFIGNSNPNNLPSSYIALNQHLSVYGATSLNEFNHDCDEQGSGSIAWPDDHNPQVVDNVQIMNTTQSDRNWFQGDAWGQPQRSCFAQLNPQSLSIKVNDMTCFRGPIGAYQPNGGDIEINHAQMLATGQEYFNATGHMVINAPVDQDDTLTPIPHQFLYMADNGAGGGYVEVNNAEGTIISVPATVPRFNGAAWGHNFHTGALIDTDSHFIVLKGEMSILGTTSGFAWRTGIPWLINLPNTNGLLDLTGSEGISQTNLNVSAQSGRCLYFHVPVDQIFAAVPPQNGTNLLCNGDTAATARADIGGHLNISGGPLNEVALSPPTLGTPSCPVSGVNSRFYKVTASNQPCQTSGPQAGLPVFGSESLPSVEAVSLSCAPPSPANQIGITWTPAAGNIPVSYGIYEGSSTGAEVATACVDAATPTLNGLIPANLQYLDVGIAAQDGWVPPATNGTGTANIAGNTEVGSLQLNQTAVPTPTSAAFPDMMTIFDKQGNPWRVAVAPGPPTPTPTPTPAPTPSTTPTPPIP